MRIIKAFRYTYSFFQTNISRLSSPSAIVPFAILSDRLTLSSVIGCYRSSGSGKASRLGSGIFVAGKNVSRNAFALSLF